MAIIYLTEIIIFLQNCHKIWVEILKTSVEDRGKTNFAARWFNVAPHNILRPYYFVIPIWS